MRSRATEPAPATAAGDGNGSSSPTGAATYVYGVARSTLDPPRITGVSGAPLVTIRCRDVAALASSTDSVPLRARRGDLRAHADVLAAVAGEETILPARFGMLFDSAHAVVRDFLEPRYRDLRRLLQEFDGLVELRVKAAYHMDPVLAEIVNASPRVRKLRELSRNGRDGASRGLSLELGTAVAAELAALREADLELLLEATRRLAEDVALEPLATDEQVVNASFLVRRSRLSRFDAALDAHAARERERMRFTCVGPLAPHTFMPALEGA